MYSETRSAPKKFVMHKETFPNRAKQCRNAKHSEIRAELRLRCDCESGATMVGVADHTCFHDLTSCRNLDDTPRNFQVASSPAILGVSGHKSLCHLWAVAQEQSACVLSHGSAPELCFESAYCTT